MSYLQKRFPERRTSSAEEARTPRPEWGGLALYLLTWTVPLGFCAGLFGLAVSSAFEVVVPRWLILGHGVACVLVALVAPLLSWPWQYRQNAGQQDHGSPMDEDLAALWATGKGSLAGFSSLDARRAAVRHPDRVYEPRSG
jgi:hypothetical protein